MARRRVSTDTDENPRSVLYDFVGQMMTDMNVEFEFQVKRSLRDWLQLTATDAPPPPPVQSQDLAAPTPAPTTRSTGGLPPGTLPLGTMTRPR